jgi:regulator of protease activity HflC (stomatin/prohibitin superfamily)
MLFVCTQWENVAVLRFGVIVRVVTEGLHTKIPLIERIMRIDTRTQEIDLTRQTTITKDNISVTLDAVLFVKVEDIEKMIVNIRNYERAIMRMAQTSLRDIVGTYELDTLLAHREELADELKEKIDALGDQWGLEVVRVGLQDISLPEDMKRAFAVQAEAERESRAIKIKAEAELQASTNLKMAAQNLTDPNAMQLRVLQTLNDISKDQSNTIIVALPTETLKSMNTGEIGALCSIGSSHAKEKVVRNT